MSKKLHTWGDMDAEPREPLVEVEAGVEKPLVTVYLEDAVRESDGGIDCVEVSYDDALKLYHRLGECLTWLYQEGLATERPNPR